LVDQDFDERIVRGVQRQEPFVEFIFLRDVDLERAGDPEVLAYAADHGLIVLSHDVSTMTAAANEFVVSGRPMCGLCVAHQWKPKARIIDALLEIWGASEAEEYRDQIQFLPL
jgi:hypothetical protein